MRAHNRAVKETTTPLFLCIDSDDYLTSPTVVEDLLNFWNKSVQAKDYNEDTICGMISYRAMTYPGKKTPPEVPCEFPVKKFSSTFKELNAHGFKGETALLFRTDILKKNLFPEFGDEKFITEAALYDKLEQQYKYILFPYAAFVCEYRPDGYTQNTRKYVLNSPRGAAYYYAQRIRLGIGNLLKNLILMDCFYIKSGFRDFSSRPMPVLSLLFIPLGWLHLKRIERSGKNNQ